MEEQQKFLLQRFEEEDKQLLEEEGATAAVMARSAPVERGKGPRRGPRVTDDGEVLLLGHPEEIEGQLDAMVTGARAESTEQNAALGWRQ